MYLLHFVVLYFLWDLSFDHLGVARHIATLLQHSWRSVCLWSCAPLARGTICTLLVHSPRFSGPQATIARNKIKWRQERTAMTRLPSRREFYALSLAPPREPFRRGGQEICIRSTKASHLPKRAEPGGASTTPKINRPPETKHTSDQ